MALSVWTTLKISACKGLPFFWQCGGMEVDVAEWKGMCSLKQGLEKKLRKNLNSKQKIPNPAVSMVSGFQGFGWTPVLCAC